jgi:hypothetical protein
MKKTLTIMFCALSVGVTGLPAFDGGDNDKHGTAQISEDKDRVRAHLSGPAIGGQTPAGSAVSQSHDGQNGFRVEVEDVNLPDNTVLTSFWFTAVVVVKMGTRCALATLGSAWVWGNWTSTHETADKCRRRSLATC